MPHPGGGGTGRGYLDPAPSRAAEPPLAPPARHPLELPATTVRPARRRPPEPRPHEPRERPVAPPSEVAVPTRKGRRRVGLAALVVAVALVSGLAGGVVGVVASRDPDLLGSGATPTVGTGGQAALTAVPRVASGEQLQQVLGSVLPAVVKVEARSDTGKATGSGVIFARDGYVLTNAHVVDGARTIGVTLSTSEPLRARFVGRDLGSDLAVLKVRRAGLTAARVGRSADLRVGDAAIVVGSPFGFQSSVTTGIVSALHRVVKVPDGEGGGEGRELVDAIQTDAAINPGNSGGALANASGEVVGISTAIATNGDSEANAGVGFAIPIDQALEVATALVDKKPVRVPFLGVDTSSELTPELVARYRLGDRAGALVSRVEPRSPAAAAGLRRGDLIVRLGDQPIPARDQLTVAVRRTKIGVPVPVTVVRRGRELVLQVTPTDEPKR
jgi:S1-C subfamily serine protease